MIDLLRNRARPFIFTTAPTPADTAAALAALRLLRSDEGTALVERLRHNVDRVRPGHPTPIVPVVLGEEAVALEAAAELLEQGLLVPAIRPPTVPPGTSRLRVALSAAHDDSQLERLAAALGSWTRWSRAVAARPERLVLVSGTGTEVGKTWVACRLARALRGRGLIVAARKPVQSYAAGDDPAGTDAALCRATGETPRWCAPNTAGIRCPWHRRWRPTPWAVRRSPWPTW